MPLARESKLLAEPGRASDDPPADLCRNCGFPGPHADPETCISGLRDKLAVLEFRVDHATRERDGLARRRRPAAHPGRPTRSNDLLRAEARG